MKGHAGPEITPELEARFWSRVVKSEGCWEWQMRSSASGYGSIQIGRRPWSAHRVSYAIAHGSIPEGPWVLHRCGNKRCVRPDHLYLGTPADNMADERLMKGEPHPEWICLSEAARQLGVTTATLRQQIFRRKIRAKKFIEWHVHPDEVERYRAEHRGRVGRHATRSS